MKRKALAIGLLLVSLLAGCVGPGSCSDVGVEGRVRDIRYVTFDIVSIRFENGERWLVSGGGGAVVLQTTFPGDYIYLEGCYDGEYLWLGAARIRE